MSEIWIPEVDDEFIPEEKHTIDTGLKKSHVFGGVLHAVATMAAKEKPIYSHTLFHKPAFLGKPIKIDRQSTGSGIHIIYLLQRDEYDFNVISQTIVTTSDLDEPQLKIHPTEMKYFRPDEFDFSQWGSGSDIMYYLTGNFRKHEAKMWLKDHSIDIGVMATLADFSAIHLVQYTNQFGFTKTLTSHFTSNMPVEKSYVKHTVEGTSNGVVFTRLDQYDDEGNPACLTRGVFRLATGINNVYPEHFGAGANSML